jgi:hypothetical protein
MGATEQPLPRIGNAPVYAIGVVTPNLQEKSQRFERILDHQCAPMEHV